MAEVKDERTVCPTTSELLKVADEKGLETAFHRAEKMKPCPIGSASACCKNCSMGPCRLSPKNPEEGRGVCGATYETIAARNFARMVAGGASAHIDHGRSIAKLFLEVARGENKNYEIKDEFKLRLVCEEIGIETKDKTKEQLALELAETLWKEFGQQEGGISFIKRAPKKRQEKWAELGILPRGLDREIVEIMHRTHIGVDQDFEHIFTQIHRTALADGWGGSMIATELSDILFKRPEPVIGKVDLGLLKENEVNIVVHGHEPMLIDAIVKVAEDEEMLNLAKEAGAEGINVVGMCCSGNEMLVRYGVPHAGNFLQSEVAIITGAVDAMAVDVQCIMQNLADLALCFDTLFVTTDDRCKIERAPHMKFDEENPIESAKEIMKEAINRFSKRKGKPVVIPDHYENMVGGFGHETINYMLGGTFRASYWPLNDNIINGRVRGVAGVVGCTNPRIKHDYVTLECCKELIKNDVLVILTGCAAIDLAKFGLMHPQAAQKYAGAGLAEVCETVGIPPCLHAGSCVDNSRVLIALSEVVKVGGLGEDIDELPVAGAAPEWMSEKAISIGQYFVSSGVYTVFGVRFPSIEGTKWDDYIRNKLEGIVGGMWDYEPDPYEMAKKMIAHIDKKRKALGIDKARERILFDMEARRKLEF